MTNKEAKKCKCDLSKDGFHEIGCHNFPRHVDQRKVAKIFKKSKPKEEKMKINEKLLVSSWYARNLPFIDLDHPIPGGYVNEYMWSQEEWVKSIRKDLKKYYKKL